jgi:transcriptional regulator with XRE-family HTH domain
MSQNLLDVAATRFPLNAPVEHAGRRLTRFIHGAGMTLRALETVCGLSRKEVSNVVALDAAVPLHTHCIERLAAHAGIPSSTPLLVVDGSLLREARQALGLTAAQTAVALGMSPWALKLVERNHGFLPLLQRLRSGPPAIRAD